MPEIWVGRVPGFLKIGFSLVGWALRICAFLDKSQQTNPLGRFFESLPFQIIFCLLECQHLGVCRYKIATPYHENCCHSSSLKLILLLSVLPPGGTQMARGGIRLVLGFWTHKKHLKHAFPTLKFASFNNISIAVGFDTLKYFSFFNPKQVIMQ